MRIDTAALSAEEPQCERLHVALLPKCRQDTGDRFIRVRIRAG